MLPMLIGLNRFKLWLLFFLVAFNGQRYGTKTQCKSVVDIQSKQMRQYVNHRVNARFARKLLLAVIDWDTLSHAFHCVGL